MLVEDARTSSADQIAGLDWRGKVGYPEPYLQAHAHHPRGRRDLGTGDNAGAPAGWPAARFTGCWTARFPLSKEALRYPNTSLFNTQRCLPYCCQRRLLPVEVQGLKGQGRRGPLPGERQSAGGHEAGSPATPEAPARQMPRFVWNSVAALEAPSAMLGWPCGRSPSQCSGWVMPASLTDEPGWMFHAAAPPPEPWPSRCSWLCGGSSAMLRTWP
jgi:hypothetical protein